MTYNEFEDMLKELDIPLKENQKKALYPMIATKDDVTVEYVRLKILEIKELMGDDITDKCLDCEYAYIDNLYYEVQCKKHNMLTKDCKDFKVDH